MKRIIRRLRNGRRCKFPRLLVANGQGWSSTESHHRKPPFGFVYLRRHAGVGQCFLVLAGAAVAHGSAAAAATAVSPVAAAVEHGCVSLVVEKEQRDNEDSGEDGAWILVVVCISSTLFPRTTKASCGCGCCHNSILFGSVGSVQN